MNKNRVFLNALIFVMVPWVLLCIEDALYEFWGFMDEDFQLGYVVVISIVSLIGGFMLYLGSNEERRLKLWYSGAFLGSVLVLEAAMLFIFIFLIGNCNWWIVPQKPHHFFDLNGIEYGISAIIQAFGGFILSLLMFIVSLAKRAKRQ